MDPYKFQIEEMVKLGCTDEHIHKVLHDIQKAEFTIEDLIRYMDENGIRKRSAAKRWTRSKTAEELESYIYGLACAVDIVEKYADKENVE